MKIDEQFIASNKALTLPGDKLLAYEHDFQNYNSFSSSDSITKRRRFAFIVAGTWGTEGCDLTTMEQLLNTVQEKASVANLSNRFFLQ